MLRTGLWIGGISVVSGTGQIGSALAQLVLQTHSGGTCRFNAGKTKFTVRIVSASLLNFIAIANT